MRIDACKIWKNVYIHEIVGYMHNVINICDT